MPAIQLEFLTPCFCAGVDKTKPEVRAASIRGQLRFWTRLLFGSADAEYLLFGGIKGKLHGYADEAVASSYCISGSNADFAAVASIRSLPTRLRQRSASRAAVLALVSTCDGLSGFATRTTAWPKLDNMLLAWELLGGLGARTTRAAGSVWPVDYSPAVADFMQKLKALPIPPSVRVQVLDRTESNSETLRQIATDTVKGLLPGNPLGFASGQERKSSPLKLKVGRFADGYRLIAVADNRHGRGGDLPFAIKAMKQRNKHLADLLIGACFDKP